MVKSPTEASRKTAIGTMSSEGESTIGRRNVLKTIAAGGTVLGLGGAGVLMGGAGATTAQSLSISDTSITTDDGTISGVSVSLTHEVTWDGFDRAVEAVTWKDTIEVPDGQGGTYTHVLYDNTGSPVLLADFSSQGSGSDGWGGSDEYTSGPGKSGSVHAGINWRILADAGLGARSVENPGDITQTSVGSETDGATLDTQVTYKKKLVFYHKDSNGNLVEMSGNSGTVTSATSQGTFTVSVTNQASTSGSTATGSSSATK